MDGLTINTSRSVLNTGRTASELSNKKIAPAILPKNQSSFAETLTDAVKSVNEQQKVADIKMQQLATGETTDISAVKLAAEKADISLRLMTSVRNKVIDAYQEIMKMQV